MTNELKKSLKYVPTIIFVGYVFFTFAVFRTDMDKTKEINRKQEIEILANRKQIAESAQFMSIVRGLTKVSKNMTPYEIVEVANIIAVQCILHEKIGLTPNKIFAIIEQESNFDSTAISSAGAYGLMQCIRATFEIHLPDMGYKTFTVALALNPIINAEAGIRELVRLRKYWLVEDIDDWMIVLTSYYYGIGYTQKYLLREAKGESKYGQEVLDRFDKWGKIVGC